MSLELRDKEVYDVARGYEGITLLQGEEPHRVLLTTQQLQGLMQGAYAAGWRNGVADEKEVDSTSN